MSSSSLPPDPPRFLLDENFSHRLGELLPTCDHDYRSRDLRMRTYFGRDVEVILCTHQPSGLREQLEIVVFNYTRWVDAVRTANKHPQPWLQTRLRGGLKLAKFQ